MKHIVITRPAHQASAIQSRLLAINKKVILFPLLAIKAPQNKQKMKQALEQLSANDLLIFISPNAVEYGLKYLHQIHNNLTSLLSQCKIAAIGKKTKKKLQHHQLNVAYVPESPFNSETFLTMSAMQKVKNQRIIIFRGEGGRQLLGDTLRNRGAKVVYANVYQRVCPTHDANILDKYWQTKRLDVICITSSTALMNLFQLIQQKWLKKVSLLLGSQRMLKTAKKLGHQGKIIIADNPSDGAMYHALQQSDSQLKKTT